MIYALIGLPLIVAALVLVLRRARYICALLTAGAFAVLVAGLMAPRQTDAWLLFGRALNLPQLESAVLGYGFCVLAVTVLYAHWVPQGELAYPVTLGVAALFTLATALRNVALSSLLLEAGMIGAVILAPSDRPGAALGGMRSLVLVALAGPLLLVAAWALETYAGQPGNIQLVQLAGVTLTIGFGIALGVVPWHIWQPALYQHGRILAIAMLSVVLPANLLLHLGNILKAATWPGEQPFTLGILLAGGLATSIAGSLLASTQRSVGRALAYVAMADFGMVLLGLGLGTEESSRAALLHMGYRGLGVCAAAMGAGLLQHVLGDDSQDVLRGAFRRAPAAMLGVMVGGLSLVGMPLTAGFTTRLSVYTALTQMHPVLGLVVVGVSLAPAWAILRFCLDAWVSTPSTERREPRAPGLLVVLLCLAILALGIWPNALASLASPWLDAVLGAVIWQ